MYKKVNLVMLPANEKAELQKFGRSIRNKFNHVNSMVGEYQHLYITSDDEIKEGDWYVNNNVLFRADDKFDEGNNPNQNAKNKLVIVTTDSSLMIGFSNKKVNSDYLPQIPKQFIEHYVNEYNQGRIITEVMVEYEEYAVGNYGMSDGETTVDERLKINQDNTINIKSIKGSYSRK